MQAPPAVLGGLFVLEFAHADDSVRFEQRRTLSVGGEWLGRVPNLALCQTFEKTEFMVQFCGEDWEPLGIAAGYKTIEEAKERTERSYHGIAAKWTKTDANWEVSRAEYEAELEAESCSFCGRNVLQVQSMVGEQARICNYCIVEFHEAIHTKDSES